MKQVKLFAVEIGLSIIAGSIFLPPASNQAVNDCSPRCWNSLTRQNVVNGILQSSVPSEDYCKALCANNGTCIGVYWSTSSSICWFQMPSSYTGQNDPTVVDYWSLSNCTGDCLPYCWKPVLNNSHVEGGVYQTVVADENTCKLLCSSNISCIGIDWNDGFNQHCWFLYDSNIQTEPTPVVRHWDIIRNIPTVCQTTTGTPGNSPTATPLATHNVTELVLINTAASTENLAPGANTSSGNKLLPAVIVLAVLLGVSVLVIIGLIIKICIKGKGKPEEPKNEAEGKYQDLQRMEMVNNTHMSDYTELQL